MNPCEFPLIFDIDYGSDGAWSMKDAANDFSNIDFEMECMTFTNLTDDYRKCTRLTSEAMNIPQIGFMSARNKEFSESPSFLDSDINFYDHFEGSKYMGYSSLNTETNSPVPLWDAPIEIDQPRFDEIFQVEESKAIQGPTLAQLNSNSELPFDNLNFSDTYTEEIKPSMNDSFSLKTKKTNIVNNLVTDISEQNISTTSRSETFPDISKIKMEKTRAINSSCKVSSYISSIATSSTTQANAFTGLPVTNVSITKLQQLLHGNIPVTHQMPDSPMSVASTSALTENSGDLCVGLQLPEEPAVRERNNSSTDRSLCSFSSLSNDESFDSSREEFAIDEDESSDADFGDVEKYNFTECLPALNSKHKSSETKRKRYFWQYNIQSKGPKGPRMPVETSRFVDPHFLNAASDPVFSSQHSFSGVKCTGKVRRGDGNDLTPNPHKLYSIGLELKKLSKIINDLEPTIEQPFNTRPKSRREKNKLASRVCRLKKKAQHEANKLKFYGLQKEHSNLCALLEQVKQLTIEKLEGRKKLFILQDVEKLIIARGVPKVAGNTAEFVNHILGRVAGGDLGGGVYEL